MSPSVQRWLGLLVFIFGISFAGIYAARPVEVQETGSMPRLKAWFSAAGTPFCGGLALMIVGALLARRAARAERDQDKGSKDGRDPASLVAAISWTLKELPKGDPHKHRERLKKDLDVILEEHVPAFLEHRPELMESMGLGPFAEMISNFAVMERNAARAWSALTDEHWAEVPLCLEHAIEGIEAVQSKHLPAPKEAKRDESSSSSDDGDEENAEESEPSEF